MARFFKLLLPMTPSSPRLSVAAAAAWLASCAQPGVQATPPLVPVAASTALTASPEEFLARCRAELVAAQDRMNGLKALPVGGTAALDAYDEAQRLLRNVDSRAGIAAELHPDKPMREAGEKCGQEADGISTGFSLDRGIYDALARIAPAGQD